ncbi:ArsR/SmtB family transcription factor [Brevibacterium ammoniilyticum]
MVDHRVAPEAFATKTIATKAFAGDPITREPITGRAEGREMADQLSKVFAALADPTRRDIVARLSVADATVSELAEPYDVSVQAVSKHLKVLEDSGLVSRSRDAQRRPVHLEDNVFDLMTKWIERYQRQAEDRYQRLDTVLEEMDNDNE